MGYYVVSTQALSGVALSCVGICAHGGIKGMADGGVLGVVCGAVGVDMGEMDVMAPVVRIA